MGSLLLAASKEDSEIRQGRSTTFGLLLTSWVTGARVGASGVLSPVSWVGWVRLLGDVLQGDKWLVTTEPTTLLLRHWASSWGTPLRTSAGTILGMPLSAVYCYATSHLKTQWHDTAATLFSSWSLGSGSQSTCGRDEGAPSWVGVEGGSVTSINPCPRPSESPSGKCPTVPCACGTRKVCECVYCSSL